MQLHSASWLKVKRLSSHGHGHILLLLFFAVLAIAFAGYKVNQTQHAEALVETKVPLTIPPSQEVLDHMRKVQAAKAPATVSGKPGIYQPAKNPLYNSTAARSTTFRPKAGGSVLALALSLLVTPEAAAEAQAFAQEQQAIANQPFNGDKHRYPDRSGLYSIAEQNQKGTQQIYVRAYGKLPKGKLMPMANVHFKLSTYEKGKAAGSRDKKKGCGKQPLSSNKYKDSLAATNPQGWAYFNNCTPSSAVQYQITMSNVFGMGQLKNAPRIETSGLYVTTKPGKPNVLNYTYIFAAVGATTAAGATGDNDDKATSKTQAQTEAEKSRIAQQQCQELLDNHFIPKGFRAFYGRYGLTGGTSHKLLPSSITIFNILNPVVGAKSILNKAKKINGCEQQIKQGFTYVVEVLQPSDDPIGKQFSLSLLGTKCTGGETRQFTPTTQSVTFSGCTPGQINISIQKLKGVYSVRKPFGAKKGLVAVGATKNGGQALPTIYISMQLREKVPKPAKPTQTKTNTGASAVGVGGAGAAQNKKSKPTPKLSSTVTNSFAKGRCSKPATQAAYRKPADASKLKARGEHLNAQDKRNLLTACQFGYRDGYADAVAGRPFAPPCHNKFIVQPRVPGPNQEKACEVGYRSGADYGNCRKKGRTVNQC